MRVEKIGKKAVLQAVNILKQGGCVAYPTDTAYGLAVDASNSRAVRRLFSVIKGRDFKKPIHVCVSSYEQAMNISHFDQNSEKIFKKFMPGALTLVLPMTASGISWRMLSAGSGTIGVRLPDHPVAQALAQGLGKPITATSANPSGGTTPYSVFSIVRQFARQKLRPDLVIDGGRLSVRRPSTLCAVINGRVTILRKGPVSLRAIKAVLRSI